MANTVIQLRNSTVTGNVPSSLANGEISINNRDGKFFYSTPAGAVITHYPYLGPAGLNKEIQFNDSGTLGSNSGLAFDKSSGIFSTKQISVTSSVGDEGGEILLAKPSTNTTLSGTGITIDSFQNKLRFFEQGGSARGAYIDLTECAGGVGTNLLNPTATPDTTARNTANAAFIQANASFLQANTPSATANSAASYANSAFLRANTPSDVANSAASYANSAFGKANSAFLAANTPSYTANSAALYANAAFTRANNSLDANNGGTVTGTITANSFITSGSFGNIQGANTVYANNFVANTGFIQFSDGSKQYTANAGGGAGSDSWSRNQANAAFIQANAAFIQANTGGAGVDGWARGQANAAFSTANNAQSTASSAQSTADAAYNTYDFASIYTPNNATTVSATGRSDTLTIVGESGVAVWAKAGTKTIAIAGTPGAQGMTVDYGYVADPLYYAIDYGTL
jgi:hypothetical protein